MDKATALKRVKPGVYQNAKGTARQTYVGYQGHACMRWIIEYVNGKCEGVPTLAMARDRLA